jgi:uncharacterized protein YbjT (DUF2867 family)
MTSNSTTRNGPVLVLGATGQQGGATLRALRDAGSAVRAAVRDASDPRAAALRALGAETVVVDLSDDGSIRQAMEGARAVFSVQPSSGQSGAGMTDDEEVRAGVAVVEAAEGAGVGHLVYSSALAVDEGPTGVAHLDTKIEVEQRVRSSALSWTILRPATFMELIVDRERAPGDGVVSFLMRPDSPAHLVAVRDIGSVAALALDDPARWRGRVVNLTGDSVTGDELARVLAERWSQPVRYAQMEAARPDGDPLLSRIAGLIDDGPLGGRGSVEGRALAEALGFRRFRSWLAEAA